MQAMIWLASYPKSGSTWFRMLLANLAAKDKPVDINDLPQHGRVAAHRAPFDYLTLIDSDLLTDDESDRLRPRVYAELASATLDESEGMTALPSARFVKTHDAYRHTKNGEALLAGLRGAEAAIVIVRDPRDIASSLANHNRSAIDDAIALMSKPQTDGTRPRRLREHLRQETRGWSGHAESWLEQTDIPVLVIRYEDMSANTIATLGCALDFAGVPATDEDIRRAVQFSAFNELRRQEQLNGFCEASRGAGGPFFRRGEAGAWRDELTAEQVTRIEAAHAPMMRRLGYALSTEVTLARTA